MNDTTNTQVHDYKKTHTRPCECCGQSRPYPTEPGRWKYKIRPEGFWHNVTVKEHEEGLTITPDGESEPMWWPSNAQWEEIED